MDAFTINDLRILVEKQSGPSVSIHMPTHMAGTERQQDALRLKTLLQRAEEQLAASWLRAGPARQLLEPVRELAADGLFWERRSEGLAVFRAAGVFQRFRVPLKLEELVVVSARFQTKPLLSLLDASERFLLLALSQNKIALWEGNRFGLREVKVSGLPDNMKQALNYDDADRGPQAHSAARAGMGTGKQTAVLHGHGGTAESSKEDIEHYFRIVDAALRPVLRDSRALLVLAGVDYVLPIYRRANHYPYLAAEELVGNYEHATPQQLHAKVWPLVRPRFDEKREQAVARFRALAGTGKASDEIREIAPAAAHGKVDALFVDRRAQVWGAFDDTNRHVELHAERQPNSDELLDLSATRTALSRGSVFAVDRAEMPSTAPAAAIFRY